MNFKKLYINIYNLYNFLQNLIKNLYNFPIVIFINFIILRFHPSSCYLIIIL